MRKPLRATPTPRGELCGACLADPPAFHAVTAAYRYAWPLSTLIQQFKYSGNLALARVLAESIVATERAPVDLIVPMPLGPARLRERGAGVRVRQLAVTAAGGLVDIRYLVVDEERAHAVHEHGVVVRNEQSGAVVEQPWMGHMPHDELRLGRTYYVLLVNDGKVVQPGDAVTIEIGGERLEHVLVG